MLIYVTLLLYYHQQSIMLEGHVSVIIPTYNGAHKLSGILNLLKDRSDQFDELIVVVDGSTDNTIELLESFQSSIPKLKIIQQQNQGRAVVRNTGAREAQGKLLIFFDDDMLPEPQCINTHISHHSKIPGSLLSGGLSEFVSSKPHEIQHYRVWSRTQWNQTLKKAREIICTETNIGISAANFSIPKQLFEDIGMFNENLTDGEDFDLAYRAYRLGHPIYLNYDAFAWHNDDIDFIKYLSRTRECWAASKLLQKKNPELYIDYYKPREKQLKSYRKYFYFFFTFRFWTKAIQKNKLLFLPQKIRYKLYDIVILANAAYFPHKV